MQNEAWIHMFCPNLGLMFSSDQPPNPTGARVNLPSLQQHFPRHNTATVNSRASEKPDLVLVSKEKCQVLPPIVP